jgi:hypothetical protein
MSVRLLRRDNGARLYNKEAKKFIALTLARLAS